MEKKLLANVPVDTAKELKAYQDKVVGRKENEQMVKSLRPVYTGDFCCEFSGDFKSPV